MTSVAALVRDVVQIEPVDDDAEPSPEEAPRPSARPAGRMVVVALVLLIVALAAIAILVGRERGVMRSSSMAPRDARPRLDGEASARGVLEVEVIADDTGEPPGRVRDARSDHAGDPEVDAGRDSRMDAGGDASVATLTVRPVAGAEVLALHDDGRTLATGRTDARGRVLLASLPNGVMRVLVLHTGHARALIDATVTDGRGSARVVLTAGARLEGSVLDESGAPIHRAQITLRLEPQDVGDPSQPQAAEEDHPAPPWRAESGEDGGFTIDTIVPGAPVRVEVAAEGYETASRRAVLLRARPQPIRLVLRRTGTIAGVVRGVGGAVVAGASVMLAGSGVWPPRSVETDAAGAYRIAGIPAGVYELRAGRAELVGEPREGVELEPGATVRADFELTRGATLHAIVVDADADQPLAGAEVVVAEEALAFALRAARSGADGAVSVVGLRVRQHTCAVRAEGFVAMVALPCLPGETALRFALRRAATISGTVVDPQGMPIRGAQIEVSGTTDLGEPVALSGSALAFRAALFDAQIAGPTLLRPAGELGVTLGGVPPIPLAATMLAATGGDPATGGGTRASSTQSNDSDASVEGGPTTLTTAFGTDANGHFRISNVPPGRIQLIARHLAYAVAVTTPRVVLAGAQIDDVQIVLPDGGVIDGRVTDARGFPVEAIRVELLAAREPYPRVLLAGADGRFEFRGVVGNATLTAFPASAPPVRVQVVVVSGATVPVTLALEADVVVLHGRVVDGRGFPVAGARVKVRSLRSRTPMSQATDSADDGTWTLEGMPTPPYSVEADHLDYAVTLLPRVNDARAEVRIALLPGAAIRGVVNDGVSGLGIAGVHLRLTVGATKFDTETRADGSYELARVPAGRHVIAATHSAYVSAQVEAVIALRGRELADVDAAALTLQAGGTLSGDVVDALGAPVSGAEVVVVAAAGVVPDWSRAARTDPQGRFTLPGVPAGEVWPSARHPAAGEAQARYASRIRAGEETPGVVLRLPERFDEERGNARLAADGGASGAPTPTD